MKLLKNLHPAYLRNLIFGAEDSLVSTVGVLFGVSTAMQDKQTILLTGLVVIAVEALSMGAGSFLSETSAQEFDSNNKYNESPKTSGIIMFSSYFIAGFIPLIPYLIFDINTGKLVSVIVALITLFILGFLPTKNVSGGIRMVVVAGLAILIGYLIGNSFVIS